MSPITKDRLSRHASQLWRFAICGGIGATIDLGSVALFVRLGMPAEIAFIPSSLLSVVFVFFANKYFTFKNREANVGNQFLKFALVYGTAIVLNIILSNGLYALFARLLGSTFSDQLIAVLAKAGAIGIGAVFNYILSHGFIFKRGTPESEEVVVI